MLLLLRAPEWEDIISMWGQLGSLRGGGSIGDLIKELNEQEDEEIMGLVYGLFAL